MVQPDPSSIRSRPDPEPAEPLVQSLEDRLLFRQAQGILVGLTDCGHADAARALRSTAAGSSVDAAAVARRFLGCLDESSAEPAKTFLLRIAELALLPDGAVRAGGPGERDAPVSAAEVIRASNGGGVHLDLAALTHVDGAALRLLDVLATRVRDGGSTLRVTPPRSAGLRRLLHFAVIMRWLPADFQEAIPASPRPGGDRTAVEPARAAPAPGRAARLARFDALYDRHASACLSLARRLVGDDGDAEDVVQAAFVATWQQLPLDAPLPRHAGAELLRRTHREAVHRLREARTGPGPPPRSPDDEPPGAPDRRHLPRRFPSNRRAGLSALPEQQARPLRLAFWSGLTVQEIAATTGSPLADVRANMLAGVRTLSHARDHPPEVRNARDREGDAH